jgi:hypothetical protein
MYEATMEAGHTRRYGGAKLAPVQPLVMSVPDVTPRETFPQCDISCLRGLRLGKWERTILLNAALPGAKQEHVKDPETHVYVTVGDRCLVDFIPDDPSSMSAARRATYRLRGAGLIDTGTHYGGRARKSRNISSWDRWKHGCADKH